MIDMTGSEDQIIPKRLDRALNGLVKAGIISEGQLAILINQAQRESNLPDSPSTSWIDLLWDRVTILRAQAESRTSATDAGRKARRRNHRTGK